LIEIFILASENAQCSCTELSWTGGPFRW